MSSNAGGPCLVCGKKSTNRCSNCAKASIDLFFCSTAHQKLAWWARKIVCGPGKANPFRQPYLTADEAEDALVHEASPVAELDGKSLAETFEHFLRPEDIAHDPRPHGTRFRALVYQRAQHLLTVIRGCEHARVSEASTSLVTNSREVEVLRLFAVMKQALELTHILSSGTPEHARVLHHLFVAMALVREARCASEARAPDSIDQVKLSVGSLLCAKEVVDAEPTIPRDPNRFGTVMGALVSLLGTS